MAGTQTGADAEGTQRHRGGVTVTRMEVDDLDALLAESLKPKIEPGDITITRLREKAHVSEAMAHKLLDGWINDGIVIFLGKRRSPNGHIIDAWRIVERKKK